MQAVILLGAVIVVGLVAADWIAFTRKSPRVLGYGFAISRQQEALRVSADDFDANLSLGAILYKRRSLDEAKPYLDRAVQLRPDNTIARYESAMLKSAVGDYAAAAQQLESVTKDDPEWLDPHVELASLYYKLHRAQEGTQERKTVERLTAEQQAKGPAK